MTKLLCQLGLHSWEECTACDHRFTSIYRMFTDKWKVCRSCNKRAGRRASGKLKGKWDYPLRWTGGSIWKRGYDIPQTISILLKRAAAIAKGEKDGL